MKKVLSIILAAAIIVCQLTIVFSVLPVKARASSLNLNCGYNATWDLDSNGVLTISGTGDMYDFTTIAIHYEKPWSLFLSEITSVVIEEGITDIGRGAFAGCSNLKSIHLPASLETINQSAFYSARNLETITVAEGSKLMCIEDTTLLNTKWYANQPDGQPIYIGRMLYKYKTSSSTPFSLNVADGTYAIADKAFYNCALTGITFPDSLASIGSDAFTGTDWLSTQPQGAIYAGNVFLKYNGTIPVSQSDFVIKNGTLGIAANSFAGSSRVMTVSIPQSVINIGNSAFSGCSNLEKIEFAENSSLRYAGNEVFKGCSALTSVNLPEKLESIGEKAFNKSGITALDLGKNVKSIGYRFAYESSLTEISVSEENLHYSADSNGILYNKDKSLLITAPTKAILAEYTVNENCKEIMSYAFAGVNVKKVTLNDGLEIIGDRVFEYCHIGSTSIPDSVKKIGACLFFYSGLTNITLGKGIDTLPESTFALTGIREVYVPSNIKIIEKGAFINCFYLRKVTILKPVKEIGSSVFEGCDYVNVYCYKNSTAYNYAIDNSISYVLLDGTVDSAEIKASLQSAAAIDRSLYTPESLADLDKAVNAVNLNAEGLTQEQVNQWKSAIDEAIKNLEYKTADYSAIDSLSEKADGIDRSLYTPESLADLDDALAAVDYSLTIDKQEQIAEWAKAIDDAISNLKYKKADYSALDVLKEKADGIDRSLYTPESLADLDNSLAAVDYSLTIDKQDQIAEWAKAIDDAISDLEYKKADYSALDVLKEKADGIDRSLYTPESLADLDNSLAAVDYSLTIDKQDQIAEWAKVIDDAIANLEYLPADYSEVRNLISKAESIDRKYYSTLSLTVLDNAINSVDYTLDITRQATVDGYAKNIKNAVSNLTYAAITLRHDGCGVIVSATAKEINPYASLSVEKVDSSEYEGTNFAVGGSIRSLNFYDINLVLNGKTVQPAGTVKVKIRLADGVNPSKCKVYHVTDDIVNPLVRYSSTIDGNYIVFETDHFSEFAVIEVETVLESIEITNLPSKTTYSPGENLVTDGLTVTAHMSDGTFLTVSDYTVGMVDLSSIGTKQVSIFYTYGNITKTASFDVTVSGDKSSADILCGGESTDSVHKKLCLFDFYTKAYIQLDCEAKNAEGCSVSWSSDNEKVLVDSNGRVTCKGLFGAKKATITLTVKDSLGNTVATDKVTVIFYKLSFQLSRLASQTFSFLKKTFFAD